MKGLTLLAMELFSALFWPWSTRVGSDSEESACNAGDPGLIPGSGRPLKKGMATYSSIVA